MNKHNTVLMFSWTVALALLLGGYGIVFAQGNVNWQPPNIAGGGINFDKILNVLPAPITDLINSAKQINSTLTYRGNNLNINTLNPVNIFGGINNWFLGITGVSLINIIKFIGNLFVWVLSLALQLVKWILSLIK